MGLYDELTKNEKPTNKKISLYEELTGEKATKIVKPKKNIFSTIGDIANKSVGAATDFYENMADTSAIGLQALGKASSWAVNNPIGEFVFGKDAGNYKNNPLYQIGTDMRKGEVAKTLESSVDKNLNLSKKSYVDPNSFIGKLPSMISNTYAMATNPLGYVGLGLSSFNQGYNQSEKAGGTGLQNALYGGLNSAIQVGTEKMFGLIGKKMGKGELDNFLINNVTKNIKNKVVQNLSRYGLKSLGEGTEELIADAFTPIAQKLTYMNKEDIGKLYKNQNMLEDFIVGSVISGILQSPSTIKGNNINSNDQIKPMQAQTSQTDINTQPSSNLANQLETMTDKARDEMNMLDNNRKLPQNPTNESTYGELVDKNVAKTRKAKVQEYRDLAKENTRDIFEWKDKKRGFNYEVNTMERNFYDIIPNKAQADTVVNEYIKPITKSNAQKEQFINQYNDKISKLQLNDKESVAVQMLGEYKYNPETEVRWEQVEKYIKDNKLDLKKIESSIETFRTTYDELLIQANKILKEQGYKEIPYRKGYFPHFTEDKPNSIIGKFAEKLGWKTNKMELPTDIAGMTDIFKPGKTWFRNAQRRTGKVTDYNALKGYDNYIRGVTDIIFHTENIQKLRALENEIRYQYSDKGVQEEIDKINNDTTLTLEEKEENIEKVYARIENQMPNLVTELRRYTDNLANKKDIGDRSTEQRFGRNFYNTMTNIHGRLSGNMVGLNISSALTNFIPLTQAYSQISTKNMSKATLDTIKSFKQDDGFADRSTFLTNRTKQADRLYKTGIEKATDKAGILFKGIDDLTANIIVRGKYLQNIEKGMSEQEAMENADQFAKDVIGGRDKGSKPTIFNQKNPIVKLFTTFQLEVNNQYGYMFKDLPRDKKNEGIAKLTMAFVKMFFGAWLYNKAKEAVTGTKSATSLFDLIEESAKVITNDNLSIAEKGAKVGENIVKEIPFVGGLFGGGRLPINAALPNVGTTISSVTNLITGDGNQTAVANNLKKELLKPVAYLVLPFGGGQFKKTAEGLGMYNKKIPGSYTSSGQLRFPVKTDIGSKIQAGLFGQYASENGRDYFDNNKRPLSERQTKIVQQSNKPLQVYNQFIKTREYKSLVDKLKEAKKQGKDTSKIEEQIKKLLKGK